MKLIKKLHPATYFFVFIIISILFYLFSNFGGAQAGIYSWIQNAWDGGISSSVITSNTNTLSEINNVTTSANKIEIQMTDPNWFDTNWKYRQVITINNPNSSTLTDFQVKIPVDTSALIASGKLQLNCADVRFTNQSGNTLSYWISEGFNECNSASTDFWVKVDNLNIGDNTIYMYYGNPSALPASDGNATFLFFDDFNAISLDLSKWDSLIVGSPSGGNWLVEDGYLKAGNNNRYLLSKTLLNGTYVVESKIYVNSLPANGFTPIGAHSNTNIQASMLFHGAGNRVYLRRNNRWILTISGLNQTGYWAISSVFVNSSNSKQQIFDIANNNIIYNYDFTLGTLLNAKVLLGARGDLYSYNQAYSASWDWVRARKIATTDVSVTINSEEKVYQLNSYATSNIFNTTFPTEWNEISFIASGTFTIKARSDFVSNMSNAQPWSSCDAVTNGLDISSNNCVNNGDQYIQFRVEFDPNGVEFGEVYEIEISYQEYDLDNPVSNASNVLLTGVTAGSWINFKPTVTWDSATDNPGGSGIYGYCIALDETDGTSSNLDPAITGGLLQSLDDGVPKAFCPFIAQGNSLDLNSIAGLNLTSGKTYFISIKAVDNGGNIFSGASIDYQDLTNFKFDNTPPDNPAFINLPVNFVSTKDITISWPVGANGASDSFSGVAGLQYRIGQTGTWYGDLHNGSEGLTDLLADDGVYTTDPTYDYPNLNEGVNKIYFRTLDNAGNVSSSLLQGDIKINTSAPSEVQNLSVTPASNNVNEYQFSWDPPATFTGLVSGLTYCYSVNTLPSSSSCNFTLPGETSIGPGAYATQPGTNTMYIVARDEASNINYATYQSITFEYTGDAPGIPTNLDIADISIKSTSNWRLALSWDVPNDVGAGIANYRIFRSTNTEISCSSNFGSFAQIGSSTSTSYIDTGLSQVTYNYCIVACDSANNCSAPTGNVVKTPTGKYTEPAKLITEPEVIQVGTRTAKINWVTERTSDSRIQLGVESGKYFDEEISNSDQVTNHFITLNNLDPGKTYYYRALWVDEDGNVGVSSEKTFVTEPAPEIQDVGISSLTTSSAIVNINNVSNATKLRLNIPGVIEQSLPISTTLSSYSIPLTNLQSGTTYLYRIYLTDIDGYEYDTLIDQAFTTLPLPQVTDLSVEEIKEVSSPTVVVRWNTNVPTISAIYYKNLNEGGEFVSTIPNIERQQEYEQEVSGLKPETSYVLYVVATDVFGNSTRSNEFTFTTATDTRPPEIVGIKIGKSNTGDEGNNAQLIVTIDTDEPTTAQVEYGEGSNGVYTQATPIDTIYKTQHNIIINELKPNAVYNLRVIVSDSAQNKALSENQIVVTSKSEKQTIELVFGELTKIFSPLF